MWPFKKKIKEPQVKTPKTKLEYNDEEFDVGVTEVILTFKDGTKFTQNIYGYVKQYTGSLHISDPKVFSSLNEARDHLKGRIPIGNCQHWNDLKTPTITVVNEFIKAELGETKSFKENFSVAKLVSYEDN